MDQQNDLFLELQHQDNGLIMHLFGYNHPSKHFAPTHDIPTPKEEDRISEKSLSHHDNTLNYRNIFDKEEGLNYMSQKLLQERVQENELIIDRVSNRKDMCTTSSKDNKMDKIAYKLQSREEKVERYLKKKGTRIWNRKIFYDCRKFVADNRQRQNGRFAKKSPALSTVNLHNSQDQIDIELCLVKEQDFQGLDYQKFNLK